MSLLAQEIVVPPAVLFLLLGVVGASLTAFFAMAAGMARGRVAPYTPRRPVPWNWMHLLAVVIVAIVLNGATAIVDQQLYGPAPTTATSDQTASDLPTELEAAHPLLLLLRAAPSAGTLALAIFVAVIVAAVTEEFFFRLLLQGWLEKVERRWRRQVPALRAITRGVLPVITTALFFASLHYRAEQPSLDPTDLIRMFGRMAIASTLTLALAIAILRLHAGARLADFGLDPQRFWSDVGLGLMAFLAIAVPIYLLQLTLRLMLPTDPIVDPVSLFFFALALGLLYYRTHRIVPSTTLHMALNATSLAMAWFFVV
jgi:membrane protease YdiL (CAAX protease family)